MDVLTLAKAKKYAQALIDTLSGEVDENLEEMAGDLEIIDSDGDITSYLIINSLRQLGWQIDEDALICEEGNKTLTNTGKFPFNNSQQTVALTKDQKNIKYAVIAEVSSSNGNAGEAVVSDKQTNGFKLAYTGSAKSAVVHYIVIGGIIK